MRAVIHLNDYDPSDEQIVHRVHCAHNPQSAADDRAVIDGVYVEWYPGGGNIHVTDDRVEEVAEMVDGRVMVVLEDSTPPHHYVENAGLVSVRPD